MQMINREEEQTKSDPDRSAATIGHSVTLLVDSHEFALAGNHLGIGSLEYDQKKKARVIGPKNTQLNERPGLSQESRP
jgi:uncharacterized protein YacL (UPF0231 family)